MNELKSIELVQNGRKRIVPVTARLIEILSGVSGVHELKVDRWKELLVANGLDWQQLVAENRHLIREVPPRQRYRKPGWGDLLARFLNWLGFTKERVTRVTGKSCGCERRKQSLNRFSAWLNRLFHRKKKRVPYKPQCSLDDVTACITTFRREQSLERLLDSLRNYYPRLKILVEQTEGNLSAARNRLAQKCETPYLLMLEDDFVFTGQTKIERLLTVLVHRPELAGVAGATNEPRTPGTAGRGGLIWWDRDFLRTNQACFLARSKRRKETSGGIEYQPCDLVLNFGIYRRDVIRQIPWDENLPVQEHTDWYWRVYLDARWHFGYVRDVVIDHLRDRPDRAYHRMRERNFNRYLTRKHGFQFRHDKSPPVLHAPNIIVLTVGRSNSSIITAMAARAFGLNLGNFDPEFHEHRDIREINDRIWDDLVIDRTEALHVLRSIPQPWIIKDPRFNRTLWAWLPLLKEYDPVLIYPTKDPRAVKRSFEKQNWSYDSRDKNNCEKLFQAYRGRKIRIRVEDLADAIALFDQSRCVHRSS